MQMVLTAACEHHDAIACFVAVCSFHVTQVFLSFYFPFLLVWFSFVSMSLL